MDRRAFVATGLTAAVASATPFSASASRRYSAMTESALKRYRALPRLSLTTLNTPLERMDRLRKTLPGAPNLYIKRDDCLGCLAGGNKLRKLEYMLAEVKRRKATAVVTVGGVSSNHARITAMAARRLGLKCVLVLNGDEPETPTANLRLSKSLGVEVVFIRSREQRTLTMAETARKLESQGERVYQIPIGSSDEIGSFGFVAAFEEAQRQASELGVEFRAIVFATGSGGTQAGLEVGKRLFQKNQVDVIGISTDGSSADMQGYSLKAVNPMLTKLGLPGVGSPSELIVDDGQVGEGYRIPTKESREAIEMFAQQEGILLDPVYTAKAAAGLIAYCRNGRFREDDHVLFWHTGGLIALFE